MEFRHEFREPCLFYSCASEAAGGGAGALRGQYRRRVRGAAEGLGVTAERRLPHVHSQPPAALFILLGVLAVRVRQRKSKHTLAPRSNKLKLHRSTDYTGTISDPIGGFIQISMTLILAHYLQDSDSAPPRPVPPPAMHPYPTFPPLGLAIPPGLSMGTGKPSMAGHPLLMHPGSQVCVKPQTGVW